MNYIKWKIEELKKYVSSTPKIEPTIPVRLEVEKITSDTYANETTYTGEQFILLDIYPQTNGTVTVTYGGLTKTITDTSGVKEPNAQQVFFGTFNGISDSVETPLSGELTIEGDYKAFGAGSFLISSKSYLPTHCGCFKNIYSLGSIKYLPAYAFYECRSLTSIEIPSSVTSIGQYAFYYCTSLTSVTIPNIITSIEQYTFYYCTSLTSIEIPNSVTSIGDYAFQSCESLTNIIIPNNVTSIGERAFGGCTSLISIIVDENNNIYDSRDNCNSIIETSTNILISGCKNSFIPNSVTNIGNNAFYNCRSLESIEIPNSVTSIEEYAFYGCRSLASIEIPNSVTSIGNSAFRDCTKLTSITIPNSVTSIGEFAFTECISLTSITIPNSVTSIEQYTFSDCTNLTNIIIPNNVTSIGRYTFYDCINLTSVTFVNTSGWYVTKTEGATSGTGLDVSNVTRNAKLLTENYDDNYWYRS